uniref:Uncharacterized protein n=1 Tax=Timema monikensis TaxID=170555 RepID=A0A7R9HN81_9NEOP|nr:unnamed protein product [Timema monikensis]
MITKHPACHENTLINSTACKRHISVAGVPRLQIDADRDIEAALNFRGPSSGSATAPISRQDMAPNPDLLVISRLVQHESDAFDHLATEVVKPNTGRGKESDNTGRGKESDNTGRGKESDNTGRGKESDNTGRGKESDNTGRGKESDNTGRVNPTDIRTSISPYSAVGLITTSALANYATEAVVSAANGFGRLNNDLDGSGSTPDSD